MCLRSSRKSLRLEERHHRDLLDRLLLSQMPERLSNDRDIDCCKSRHALSLEHCPGTLLSIEPRRSSCILHNDHLNHRGPFLATFSLLRCKNILDVSIGPSIVAVMGAIRRLLSILEWECLKMTTT